MKRIFGLIFVVALCSMLNAVNGRVAFGMDSFGELFSVDKAMRIGQVDCASPTVSVQVMQQIKNLSLGAGADYHFNRNMSNADLISPTSFGTKTMAIEQAIISRKEVSICD